MPTMPTRTATPVVASPSDADAASPSDRDAAVPPLRTAIHGHSFGGQYWSEQEYELTLTPATDGPPAFTWTLCDPSGAVIAQERLGPDQARELMDSPALATTTPVPSLPAITCQLTWTLVEDQSHQVRLGADTVQEIAEWLTYATGRQTWDFAELGDEWSY